MSEYFRTFCENHPEACKYVKIDQCVNDDEFLDQVSFIKDKGVRFYINGIYMDEYLADRYGRPTNKDINILDAAFSMGGKQ